MKTYTADAELAALIKEAIESGEPLRVRANQQTYEVEVRPANERDIWADYDPEAVGEALKALFGSAPDINAEELIQSLRDERDQDSPGRPAWNGDRAVPD